MQRKIFLIFGIVLTTCLSAQEFTTFKNGLIYNESTMDKLGKIVDSLHLKYKTCDLNKIFYSKKQVKGYIIKLDSGNVTQAKRDIDNNISFEDFITKYPEAVIKKDVLITKTQAKDYDKRDIIMYSEISINDDYGFYIRKDYKKAQLEKPEKNTWKYEYNKKTSYSKESVEAFYFPENFKSIPFSFRSKILKADYLF